MSAAAANEKVLTFFVGGEEFAVNAADVLEIFRPPRLTRVPNGPPSLLGIGSLRGTPAPVISLARLLGREEKASADSRLLLVESGQAIGLSVDRIGALTGLPAGAEGGRLYRLENGAARLLDLDTLLRREFSAQTAAEAKPAPEAAPAIEAARVAESAFLAFDLAGQAYALPIAEVAEVLALPPEMTKVAQSDDAVLGVTSLRDRLLPVVSLRHLLGLPKIHAASDRVVVARVGDVTIGLAVDRLRAILRVADHLIDPAPAILNRGEGEAQVQSIGRLPKGKELLAILSGERLFRDEKMAPVLADGRDEDGAMQTNAVNAALERFLVFRLGDEEYGLPLASIDEVVRLPDRLTRVPNAPDFVEGIITLRGKVIPVIDQRTRFASAGGKAGRARIVVTRMEGRKAGFIVDTTAEILAVGPDDISATPDLAAEAGRLFSRVASLDGGKRLVLLIEPRELLDKAEQDMLAHLVSASDVPQA